MIRSDLLTSIGNTPLFSLEGTNILAKAEYLNPGGSVKDRVALAMIEAAEARAELRPGMRLVEATSGNTGIALALVGAAKGYGVSIVMPEGYSPERAALARMLGAEVIRTPAALGMAEAVARARAMAEAEDVYMPDQFANPDNAAVHRERTAAELWSQCEGRIDVFVSGIGSGGTLQGIGTFLKQKHPGVSIVAVEPRGASALLGQPPRAHALQGIGDGFVPEILDTSLIDRIIEVGDDEAMDATRLLAQRHGMMGGITSGANYVAALALGREHPKHRIAMLLPDGAERYFSTGLFADQTSTGSEL